MIHSRLHDILSIVYYIKYKNLNFVYINIKVVLNNNLSKARDFEVCFVTLLIVTIHGLEINKSNSTLLIYLEHIPHFK